MTEAAGSGARRSRPTLLLLAEYPALEAELAARFAVQRWSALADPGAWLAENAGEVRAIVTGAHVGVSSELMRVLPALGIIAIYGVGYDRVDLELARARGVRVTNTPGVLTQDVADLAIALFLALFRKLPEADSIVKTGAWPRTSPPLGRKASGRRCGILGLGRIGLAIARRLEGFGAEIVYCARSPKPVPYSFAATPLELARRAEVLFVASSAEPGTRPLVDRPVIEALGPEGALVNVARGALVDEPELIAALTGGRLGGAALDVFSHEPDVPEALRTAPNVVLTPHIGSATIETRAAMGALALANLDAFLAGDDLVTPVI